jgi:hypothetical protein
MVIEAAALLNRRVTHMTPAALFSRRLHRVPDDIIVVMSLRIFEVIPFAFSIVHVKAMGLSEARPTNDRADKVLFSRNVRNVSKSRPWSPPA